MAPRKRRTPRSNKESEGERSVEESPSKQRRIETTGGEDESVAEKHVTGNNDEGSAYEQNNNNDGGVGHEEQSIEKPVEVGDGEDDENAEHRSPKPINKRGRPAEAGIIKKVYVENFMCHRKMTIKLCRNVNFIHGQNGSGKSAVLAAIQICLGAGARRTHRARNLRELVRHEAGAGASAKVRVTLWNEGNDGFEPDTYGDEITIERCISKTGSGYNGYKLYGADEEEKSRSKQDLDRLLDHLNIQVENPVAVLDQEEAKKFLTGKPQDKYSFFCKATELERMDRSYSSVIEHIDGLDSKKRRVETKLQPAREQVRELQREFQKFQILEKLEEKVLQVELQHVWANYHEFELEARTQHENLEKVYAKREKRLAELTQAEELSCTQDEEKRRQERINELVAEAEKAANDKRELEQEVKRAHAPVRTHERQLQHLEREKGRAQKNLQQTQKALEQERQRILSGAAESEQARRTKQLQDSEEELQHINTEQQQVREITTQLQRRYEELEPSVEHARHHASSLRNQVGAVEAKLRNLGKSGGNSLAVFGNKCSRVWTMVQQALQGGEFKGPVVGPIGNHIKITPGKEAFAALAEFTLGAGVLDRFVVTNDHDRKAFQGIRNKAGCSSRECGIFQMHKKALEGRYNIPRTPNGIHTVATCLNIEDDLVFNCLVDNCKIETRALADSKDAGEKSLLVRDANGREEMRVRFIKEVFSLPRGDHWKIMGGARAMVSNERKLRQTIGIDQTAAMEEAKQELALLNGDLNKARADEKEVTDRLRGFQVQWNQEKRKLRDFVKRKEQLETMIDRLRAETETAANFATETTELEEEVSNAEQQVSHIEQQMEDIGRQMEGLKPAVAGKKKELQEVTARNQKIIVDLRKAEQDMEKFLQSMSQRQEVLARKRQKVEQIEAAVQQFEEAVQEKERDRDKCLRAARVLQYRCNARARLKQEGGHSNEEEEDDPRRTPEMADEPSEADLEGIEVVETEHPPEYYESKMKRLHANIEKEKRRQEISKMSPEEAYEKYMRAKTDLESKTKEIDNIEENLQKLGDDVRRRIKLWKRFRHHLVDMTSKSFDEFLNRKGSCGDLNFDHEAGTLDLVVQKDGNEDSQTDDVKALSGGERSYTTLALLLALGERLETPFRVMDEFDVFLDPVARRLALAALIEVSQEMEHRQFIFITPQDLSSLQPSKKLMIHRMKPPARSAEASQQQTID